MLPPPDEMDDRLLEQMLEIIENADKHHLFYWYCSNEGTPEVDRNRIRHIIDRRDNGND